MNLAESTSRTTTSSTTVPLARTEVCGKKNTVWSRRAAILNPKFNQEHDARISFGHRARVQQPARACGRLPGRQPARAHASNEIPREHPVRSQNSDHACMRSCCLHARLGGRRHEYEYSDFRSTARTRRPAQSAVGISCWPDRVRVQAEILSLHTQQTGRAELP